MSTGGTWSTITNFLGIRGKGGNQTGNFMVTSAGGSNSANKNINNTIFPNNPNRTAQDMETWRDVLKLAEQAVLPMRHTMQFMFEDTVLNDHVNACMTRRKELTTLRKFVIRSKKTEECYKDVTELFKKSWFTQVVLPAIIDARAYGYNLVSLGDVKDGVFVDPVIIKRTHVSPDRKTVAMFVGSPVGTSWEEGGRAKWHLWIPTPSTNAFSTCGYGYLYPVARLEILGKINWAFNAQYVQMFAQPIRELKTNKTEGFEREEAQKDLEAMGSCAYLITDPMDTFTLHNGSSNGNGYKSYNDLRTAVHGGISKIILGHEDAISSVPGKLGASQLVNSGSKTNDGDAATPVAKALRDRQTDDGQFVEDLINDKLLGQMREIGFVIPDDAEFLFLNDAEEREVQALVTDKNQKVATLALTMMQGGLKMDESYFTEMTGVPCTTVDIAPPTDVTKDKGEQAKGKDPLKDESKKREDKPKKTN